MIPRTVVVNGVAYRVTQSREHLESKDDAGLCCPEQSLIVVAKELSSAQARATYLHEVGHAAMYESGAREILKDYSPNPDRLEELLLQVFAPVYRLALGVK